MMETLMIGPDSSVGCALRCGASVFGSGGSIFGQAPRARAECQWLHLRCHPWRALSAPVSRYRMALAARILTIANLAPRPQRDVD